MEHVKYVICSKWMCFLNVDNLHYSLVNNTLVSGEGYYFKFKWYIQKHRFLTHKTSLSLNIDPTLPKHRFLMFPPSPTAPCRRRVRLPHTPPARKHTPRLPVRTSLTNPELVSLHSVFSVRTLWRHDEKVRGVPLTHLEERMNLEILGNFPIEETDIWMQQHQF